MKPSAMTNSKSSSFQHLDPDQLLTVAGGARNVDFNAIRRQAQEHCPKTAARYADVDPSSVTRPQAVQLGGQCLAEMGSFKATFARPVIERAIESAFPRTH